MQRQEQPVLALREPEQPPSYQRPTPEIEGRLHLGLHPPPRLHFALGQLQRFQVIDLELHALMRRNELNRTALFELEARAQRLVPLQQIIERPAERLDLELTTEPIQLRNAVHRPHRQQPVQQPQPLLRKGDRESEFVRRNGLRYTAIDGASVEACNSVEIRQSLIPPGSTDDVAGRDRRLAPE